MCNSAGGPACPRCLLGWTRAQFRTGICLSPLPAGVDAGATPHRYRLCTIACTGGHLHNSAWGTWLSTPPDRVGACATPHWHLPVSVVCSGGRMCNSALVAAGIRCQLGWSLVQLRSCVCLSPLPSREDTRAAPHGHMLVSAACLCGRRCNSALASAGPRCLLGWTRVQLRAGICLLPLPVRVHTCAAPHG